MALNIYIGNYVLFGLCVFISIIVTGYLYLLRVKRAYKTAFYSASLSIYPILTYNFLHNDGINGPTFYVFLLIHLVILSIVKSKYYLLWTVLNVVFFIGLYYIGLYHENWVPINYGNKEEIFTDQSVTYTACIIGISLVAASLKYFYGIQKNRVRQQREELTKVNKSLKQTSDKKDRIITIISHDLKNPLQSIIQTLELINSGDLTEEEAKYLREELLKTTNRTYQMMENILEWSSFEIKNVAGREKKILVKELVEDTVEILKVISKQKRIQLEVNFLKNPMVYIETDRLLLIFRNLVQNAIKFTPAGGLVTVNINSSDGQLILEITDNGIGISADRLKNIFEQDIKSTYGTEQEKGTGMGLHLCFQSAHKLNGQLEVKSTEGVGSSFKLVIPTGINKPSLV
ncbi:sensor histidine kinase [Cyclobacterium qasimii]|nr:HAMP domain-containing sensor histidine kinase [Cyclobacterium qasimii]EPR65832.1 hypothetical protein ADICYQ_5180 [Cyclobacterium qasimii M12-11B]